MKVSKEEFLSAAGRLRAQYEIERCTENGMDTSNIWIAVIGLLGGSLGRGGVDYLNRWIYDTEFGRYPDPLLGNASDNEEFWNFLVLKNNE